MAVSNDFAEKILGVRQSDEGVLWVAGFPQPIEGISGNSPGAETVRLAAPLHRYTLSHTGKFTRSEDAAPGRYVYLSVRSYTNAVVRLTVSLAPDAGPPQSDMLAMDPSLKTRRLVAREEDDAIVVGVQDGSAVASFRQSLPATKTWSDLMQGPDQLLDGIVYGHNDRPIRVAGYDQFFPAMRDSIGLGFLEAEDGIRLATFSIQADSDEWFCGTGERFAQMDLSGRTIELINQDALGVNTQRAYKNVPFYLSNKGYGLFVDSSARMTLSMKGVSSRSVVFGIDEDSLDLFFIPGSTPEEVLRRYRQLTGFPPELPLWSYGTWMSRMTYFSADEINEITERLRREKYPCDVIHIDTGWFDRDWVCEWRFSEERFPDPVRFIHGLKKNGFRVSLWQNPNIGAGNRLLEYAVERGFIPRPAQRAAASGSDFAAAELTGQIDFTNPDAVNWYRGLLRDLFDKGASAIKTDFGEEIRTDVSYHGMAAAKLRNIYCLLYQRAAFEQTRESTGKPIIWARAGWAGCQRYPVHWGGDAASTWDGLAGSLRGGLHLGLSGFGYWSHDVPGFHGMPDFMNTPPDPELYVRWTQFGVLSSHLRYHGTYPREPWHYPDVAPIVREWLKLRYALIPYLIAEAKQMSGSGMPMLRALFLHYPEDPVCRMIDDQYFLGSSLLVAPLTAPGGGRSVYLPQGRWVDVFTGDVSSGPTWIRDRQWSLGRLPLYAAEGARIPVYPLEVQCTDEMDVSRVVELLFDGGFDGLQNSPLGKYIDL